MSATNKETGEFVRLYSGHKAFLFFEKLSDEEKSKFDSVADWWLSLGKVGRRKMVNDYLHSCWTPEKVAALSEKNSHQKSWLKSRSQEEQLAYRKKMSDMWTPEMRDAKSKQFSKMWADMSDDRKRQHSDRIKEFYTDEVRARRRQQGLNFEASLTDEQRKARSQKFKDWMTPERRLALREASKRSYAAKTDEEKMTHYLNTKRAVAGGVSQGEKELLEFIRGCTQEEVIGTCTNVLPGKELDIYIPSLKLAFEYNGVYWHSDRVMNRLDNYRKYVDCQKLGIRLIQIWESDWVLKRPLVESLVKSALGVSTRIYARDCTLCEVSSQEKNKFLDEHHMQGADRSLLNVGLRSGNELVAVMTFRRSRSNKDFELSRYCGEVVGGFSRLLKYASPMMRNLGATDLISYSDNMVFSGEVYRLNGWELVGELPPDYKISFKAKIYHKSSWRKENIIKRFPEVANRGLTEWQMEDEVGALRIWDCGKKKWRIRL